MKMIEIKLDIPKNDEICVLGGGVIENYGYVNDQFWCHNIEKINIMKNFYIELPYIIQDSLNNFLPCHGCWIEHLFVNYVLRTDFNIKRSILSGVFIRELY